MGQSLWLPVVAFLVGAIVVLFFAKPRVTVAWDAPAAPSEDAEDAEDAADAARQERQAH
jgi:hypothetical protein